MASLTRPEVDETPGNIARRGPVNWSNYEMKLNQLDILFRFISHAFDNLSETKRRDFVRSLKQQAESDIVRKMEKMRELSKEGGILHGTFDETTIKEMQARQRKKVKASYRGRTHTQYVEWVNEAWYRLKLFSGSRSLKIS